MSVIVVARWRGDPARLEAVMRSRPADVEAMGSKAMSDGALHHRFVAGDGELLSIDEWESAEAFDAVYPGQPIVRELVREAGFEEPPEVRYYRPMSDLGEF